jgi:hypothetical protein
VPVVAPEAGGLAWVALRIDDGAPLETESAVLTGFMPGGALDPPWVSKALD